MSEHTMWIIVGVLLFGAFVVILLLISGIKKSKINKKVEELHYRFNKVKTIPLAFKLSKAQAAAKKNESESQEVESYYKKYEECEDCFALIQELLNNLDDSFSAKEWKQCSEYLEELFEKIEDIEKKVEDIDQFVEQFSKQENDERELSTKLKEKYRIIKNYIHDNSNLLSIAYDGLMDKIRECENRFSSSEEALYASEYVQAQDDLDEISNILDDLDQNVEKIPELIKDCKGVLPLMIDEVRREYALSRQRGVFVDHLNIEEKISQMESNINENVKKLMLGQADGMADLIASDKEVCNELTEALKDENRAYKEAKETCDKAYEYILDLEKLENYVRVAYDKDSARFGLENLNVELKQQRERIEVYKNEYHTLCNDIASLSEPSTKVLDRAIEFAKKIDEDKRNMYSYKTAIDRSTDGELRAQNQLIKLQVVINIMQTKVKKYHLPTISSSYEVDLKKSKDYIARIKLLLEEIPIAIDELNGLLDEAIDFIYKFYNNVNNIVGMAIMVENTIVFGNKYRSTYPQIDHDLSIAEFQYLNGEYTKALRTAISCMEELFPENADEVILENTQ